MKYVFLVAVLGVLFFAVFAIVLVGALSGGIGGGSRPDDLATTELGLPTGPVSIPNGIEKRSCIDIRTVLSNIPEEYLSYIAEAADRWLGGDQAKVIAVIHFESGFNRLAMSSTGAVGVGQFITDTARSKVSFRGSTIYNVEPRNGPLITVRGRQIPTLTESDKQTFRRNHPYDGRFVARRSVNAVAEYVNYNFKQAAKDGRPGDFRWAYAKYYNGEDGNKKFENADKMLALYQRILDKDCKS